MVTVAVCGATCPAALAGLPTRAIAAWPARVHIMQHGRSSDDVPYDGGPVLHHNRTHLIFWEPSGSGLTFDPDYETVVETFLENVAAASHSTTSVYGLTGQYTDSSGPAANDSIYAGAVIDTDRLPPNECVEPPVSGPGWTTCLTDAQLQAEIEHVVRTDDLPTAASDIYFLITPDGFGSCISSTSQSCALGGSQTGYCGYHALSTNGQILYAVIPYNAVSGHCQSNNPRPNSSTADPALSTIAHEQIETITDPYGNAWIENDGNEIADLCLTTFGPRIGGSGQTAWNEDINGGHYWLQEVWSNDNHGCEPRAGRDQVSFALATTAGARRAVRFTASARDPEGSIVSYLWTFGDGTSGRGQIVQHTFGRPGSYVVILRTTDSSGNWAFYTRTVRVSARPRGGRRRGRTKSG